MNKLLSVYISDDKVQASKTSNVKVLDRLGDAVLRKVVTSILQGGNLRDLTEAHTRKRILLSNVALIVLYLKMLSDNPKIEETLSKRIGQELAMSSKIVPPHKRDVLLSLIGMTKKGWDNILRGEAGKFAYIDKLDKSLSEIESEICSEYGALEADFVVGKEIVHVPTSSLLRCILAVGSQTLTIRGSEKSTYGKLFERLVLGSVLTILGFEKIDRNDLEKTEMVFWLSDPKNKRECDATALISPGVCVRFDIGFIGRGNTEISLDKVSRYERVLELACKGKQYKATSHTIIIVDTIGEASKAWAQAVEIGGDIIQMNSSYWVKELAQKIQTIAGKEYKNPLMKVSPAASLSYIYKHMTSVDFMRFMPNVVKDSLS